MIKLSHYIDKDGTYYLIKQTENSEKIVLSIELHDILPQVIISTENEVYAGPIDFLKITEEVKDVNTRTNKSK